MLVSHGAVTTWPARNPGGLATSKFKRETAMLKTRLLSNNGLVRAALGICLLVMVACGDSGSDSAQYMVRAEQEFAAGNYPTAIIELKNALADARKKQTTLPRARWMLGKAYLETGDIGSAEKELERAHQLGWNSNEVLPALAKTLLAQGKMEAVTELSTTDLEPLAAAQLKAYQAVASLAQGDVWMADTLIAGALELQPDDVEVQLAEARVLGAMDDVAGALAALELLLAAAPEYRPAWSLKGKLLSYQQKLPEAVAALDTAIELSPGNFDDRSKRALINLQLQQLDAAKVDADWLLKTSPQHPISNYVQGLLDFQNGDYADSIRALTLAEPAVERYPQISFYLAAAHLVEGHREEALSHAMRQVSLNPDFAPGRKLLASIYLQKKNADEAQTALRPVLDRYPDDIQALNLMANALLLDGKTDQALDMLAKAQQLAPDSPEASFRLGAGLLFAGQTEAATRQLESALALDQQLQQADILLVLSRLEMQDFDGAIEAAQAYVKRNPMSVTANNLMGRVYLANNQTEEAATAFNKALAQVPGDPAANHALAQIALLAGDMAAARSRYQEVLTHRPDYLPALLQLVILDAEEGKEAEVLAQLERAITVHPNALEPRLLLARYYLWKDKPAKIPPLFATLPELQKQSPQALHLLALSQLAEQQHGAALYSLEQLIKLEPDTALAHHLLATAAAGAGDFDRARSEFERAAELDDSFPPTLVSLARLAWADGNAPQFDRYLERLTELAPNSPSVLRLQAAAAQRDGDSGKAIALARQVVAVAPGTDTMLELAGYLYMSGNSAEALQVVQDWVSKNPMDIKARMALASQLNRAGKPDQAIKQYRQVVELQADNVLALNNLAWHLRLEHPEDALIFARRAVALDPDGAQVLDTLAFVEHGIGNHREAQRHIKRALADSPDNPTLRYHQAMIEASLGDKKRAVSILTELLDGDNAVFSERKDAELLLVSLRQ
jgi:putative PEP-CTERM system TPR-repeat lipoprotein